MEKGGLLARCGNCSTVFCFARSNPRELLKCYSCGVLNQPPSGPDVPVPEPIPTKLPLATKAKPDSSPRQPGIVEEEEEEGDQFESDLKKALEMSMQPPLIQSVAQYSEEDELKAALEASLRDARSQNELELMGEDEMIKMAIAQSLQSTSRSKTGQVAKTTQQKPPVQRIVLQKTDESLSDLEVDSAR